MNQHRVIRNIALLGFCFAFVLSANAQQTSTDTSWKVNAQKKGQKNIPPYPKWLVVAQDGSGDYKTIQEAVNAVRDLSQEPVTIHIKPGIYHEKIIIPSWKTKVHLQGEDNQATVITNSDYSGKDNPGGKDAFGRPKYSTYTSYTVLVQGDDFTAENITIENKSGRVGQAVALHVEGDRAIIKNCRLLGNQDTLYAATETSRQYYKDCYIEGTTDFIFGEATAVFHHCTIKSLVNSFITAAATTPGQKFGYVFLDCKLVADTAATKCFLGRPWRPYAKTVFINTEMGSHILPTGWNNWGKTENEATVYYAEYRSKGPGAASAARAGWSKQLTDKEAKQYTLRHIFQSWDPQKETAQPATVQINVDAAKEKGPMTPIWAWFGYDEPNYTYMKDGRKLLSEIAAMSPVPVHVRVHNLMTSGDGSAALKWGSTNMYTEDKNGNPVYYWNIVDSIFDTFIKRKMKPLAQIGFMPEALSSHPQPYQHHWKPGDKYGDIHTGWSYPPNDYNKWAELIYQWVKHCIERYGKTEVESWYWELWNEPNSPYLQAQDRLKTYCKMYDYASDAVKRALPSAKVGGPHTTGGGEAFMRGFIVHCLKEMNAATGKTGAPIDFLAFHAKGSPKIVNDRVRMGMYSQLRNIRDHLSVIASFPETKHLPVIVGESDPEGCAACGMKTDPQNAYRNGTMYSSYTAASVSRIYDINDQLGTNLVGAVNWSFEFENQPWFYGFRDLATNGVDKPVLNVFRMLGMMQGRRVEVSGNFPYDYQSIIDSSVRGTQTDINAIAAKSKNSLTVMLWNYHDDDMQDSGSSVMLSLQHITVKKAKLYHYRIDNDHSNAYEMWKKMGSPQQPTEQQYRELEKAGQLQLLSAPKEVTIKNGKLTVNMQLPRQAVSLVRLVFP